MTDVGIAGGGQTWRGPRDAYELAAALAAGDKRAIDAIWDGLSGDDRAGIVIALGAQVRFTARTAQFDRCKPFTIPADVWDQVPCADVLKIAKDAYAGATVRLRRGLCGDCLRSAAEILASLLLLTLQASGVPDDQLSVNCARSAERCR